MKFTAIADENEPERENLGSWKQAMSLLVTGSIGIDTVETPSGRADDVLGGSSIYFSYAASFFSPVRLVGVVGDDLPVDFLKPLEGRSQIDLSGVEVREGSKTFRWVGRYHEDVNERDTVSVELNVLAEGGQKIPEVFRDSRYVFLANTHPDLQADLLSQLTAPALVVADTMDLWINTERESLERLLERLDGLVLNDSEVKLFTGEPNVIVAGLRISETVRRFVVVKKGEHGSLLFADGKVAALPSFPAHNVVDPTGAGDSFAGAMMGYLAAEDRTDPAALRRAIAYGTVTASFVLEDFSLNRFVEITRDDIEERLKEFEELTRF
ncbi:MAG: PfkB family carbohydrate kinase [Planctomycetota bacterium]